MNIRRYFLLYTILPLLVLSIGSAYVRTYIESDYIVEYETECKPTTESCFVGCEDEECTSQYPYKYIQKSASDIKESCSGGVDGCTEAQTCQQSDSYCEVKYCSLTEDDCFSNYALDTNI